MRKIEETVDMRNADGDLVADIGVVDWNGGPDDTLAEIDDLLATFGLEVVMIDSLSGSYMFRIAPKHQ